VLNLKKEEKNFIKIKIIERIFLESNKILFSNYIIFEDVSEQQTVQKARKHNIFILFGKK